MRSTGLFSFRPHRPITKFVYHFATGRTRTLGNSSDAAMSKPFGPLNRSVCCSSSYIVGICIPNSTDNIEFVCGTIRSLQTQLQLLSNFNLGSSDSSGSVENGELRGQEEHYGTMHDKNSFEICKL